MRAKFCQRDTLSRDNIELRILGIEPRTIMAAHVAVCARGDELAAVSQGWFNEQLDPSYDGMTAWGL